MQKIKKAFYVVAPLLAFSYLAYEVMAQDVASGMTRRGKAGHDLLVWLTSAVGPVPLASGLMLLGVVLALYAYRNY